MLPESGVEENAEDKEEAKDRAEEKEVEGVVCCSREVEKGSSWSEGDSGDLKRAAQVIRETGRSAYFETIAIKETWW